MCNLKSLHDGTQVPNDSEEWRHECEAATLLRMPLAQRKAHLLAVEAKRGIPERQRLQGTLMALWINQQADKLAAMSEYEREQRMQALARDNKEHIMRRIQARLNVVMAANENNNPNPERTAA